MLKEPTLSGHTLQLITKVKYLGLVLDKALMWKTQLKYVTNKAYRNFWTCKDTFGESWGVKPRVVYWMYTMVTRFVLTYSSMLWSPSVRYSVSRMELSKYRDWPVWL